MIIQKEAAEKSVIRDDILFETAFLSVNSLNKQNNSLEDWMQNTSVLNKKQTSIYLFSFFKLAYNEKTLVKFV